MDLRLVSLLLLLAYACGAWSRTTRNYPRIAGPRRPQQQQQQQRLPMQRRSAHLLQRPVRAISEFLEPPPLPPLANANHAQFSPSSSYRLRKPSTNGHNQKHNVAQDSSIKHARNGRYARPQSPVDPAGYLGNLISWLNPFAAKDAQVQGSSDIAQYAPRMPYTVHAGKPSQTAAPVDQFPRASSWTSGNSCNPCDVFPWTPVIRNDVPPYSGQYAANYGPNSHIGYSHSAPWSHSESAPTIDPKDNNPHLSSGATPPLYQAQPFRDAPTSPGQIHPPVFHQVPYWSSDHHRQQEQQQYDHPAAATSNQHYSIEIQQSPIIDVEQAPVIVEEHPPPPPPLLDYHQTAATKPIQAQHESSQHVDAPVHLDTDQAESRPVIRVASETVADNSKDTSVHFQRSPLIELSVAGESTLAGNSNRLLPKAKASAAESSTIPPAATLIDYIVSSPRETITGRQETRPTASTTTTSTSTEEQALATTVAADAAANQKLQESHIETLVQSYEFFKKNSDRSRYNETMKTNNSAGRVFSSENDDFSASREAVAPPSNSSDSAAKKIIQIIIPYTSEYTPSPFHPTKSVKSQREGDGQPRLEQTTPHHAQLQENVRDNSIEDSGQPIIQESRRVPTAAVTVTRAPEPALRNNHSGNSIDVHRLQKNIDNWTIQEFSKKAIRNLINTTYPRWISSKQIPDEYLLAATAEGEDSNEYYDFSHETQQQHRGINQIQVMTTTSTTTTTEPTSRVKVVNAIYPKSTKKPEYLAKLPSSKSGEKEKVYVVTPIPNSDSLEIFSAAAQDNNGGGGDGSSRSKVRRGKVKKQNSDGGGLEQAYQVLPQAVNNLAVLANAPESAAPALWGIMEHEQIAASPNQPRWRSESDVLPEPASTPVLYAGHSKVTYFRTKVH